MGIGNHVLVRGTQVSRGLTPPRIAPSGAHTYPRKASADATSPISSRRRSSEVPPFSDPRSESTSAPSTPSRSTCLCGLPSSVPRPSGAISTALKPLCFSNGVVCPMASSKCSGLHRHPHRDLWRSDTVHWRRHLAGAHDRR